MRPSIRTVNAWTWLKANLRQTGAAAAVDIIAAPGAGKAIYVWRVEVGAASAAPDPTEASAVAANKNATMPRATIAASPYIMLWMPWLREGTGFGTCDKGRSFLVPSGPIIAGRLHRDGRTEQPSPVSIRTSICHPMPPP